MKLLVMSTIQFFLCKTNLQDGDKSVKKMACHSWQTYFKKESYEDVITVLYYGVFYGFDEKNAAFH